MCFEECFKVWFVYFPKAVASSIVGMLLGLIPTVVFAVATTAITLVRTPINFWITFKVALTSLILRPGLR